MQDNFYARRPIIIFPQCLVSDDGDPPLSDLIGSLVDVDAWEDFLTVFREGREKRCLCGNCNAMLIQKRAFLWVFYCVIAVEREPDRAALSG